jgi:aspartate-semialdehyde dehydrogenase
LDKVALVGSDTLLGREIRDLWSTAAPSGIDLKLIASEEEEIGRITAQSGEPALIERLESMAFEDVQAAILAGSAETARKAIAASARLPLIDLTYAAEEHPEARLRAPLADKRAAGQEGRIHVIAHPAAAALASLAGNIQGLYPITRWVAHVFEPASERGRAGIDEIQQQTVNLLSFKGLPKDVYDAQVAFAMLAAYGEEAPESLESIELRLERHLATLLSGWNAPMPSVRLIHAPVFHGHSFSIWIEFQENPGVRALEQCLAAAKFDVFLSTTEPPNNVGIAGQSQVATGGIHEDRNNSHACWVWAAADNVRISAENALAVVKELV